MEGLKVALFVAPLVYVLASGPAMRLPGHRNEVDGPHDLSDWPVPYDTVFHPLARIEQVPYLGRPLTWYYGLFRPDDTNTRFESVRDALTSIPSRTLPHG